MLNTKAWLNVGLICRAAFHQNNENLKFFEYKIHNMQYTESLS